MNSKNQEDDSIRIIQLPLSEELMIFLKSGDESLKDLTKVTNNAGWYVNKPGAQSH